MNDTGPRGNADKHIAIIGSGAAAFGAALRATELGARVTMIERGTTGGTCVNVGCVPSKILIHAAEIAHTQSQHPFDGITRQTPAITFERLHAQQMARVDELRANKYERIVADTPAIALIQGDARFRDERTLEIKQDAALQQLTPDAVLIATGRRPAIPDIDGLRDTPFWMSTDVLGAAALPTSIIVYGAGVVAVELAQALARLGTRVTLVARGALLAHEDPLVGVALSDALRADGITLMLNTTLRNVRYAGDFEIATSRGTLRSERLLIAAGRTPNTEALNVAAAGIKTTVDGAIEVNAHLRTTAKNIYAAGDCTTQPQFVYVAAAAGKAAADNMLGHSRALDLTLVPRVVFTDPQVASVGVDEAAAHKRGIAVETRVLNLSDVPRALVNFDTRGFVKLIAKKNGSRAGALVGAQIVAAQAGEIVTSAMLAIRHGMTPADLAAELFPYLTHTEALKLCAQTFTHDVARLSCCAG